MSTFFLFLFNVFSATSYGSIFDSSTTESPITPAPIQAASTVEVNPWIPYVVVEASGPITYADSLAYCDTYFGFNGLCLAIFDFYAPRYTEDQQWMIASGLCKATGTSCFLSLTYAAAELGDTNEWEYRGCATPSWEGEIATTFGVFQSEPSNGAECMIIFTPSCVQQCIWKNVDCFWPDTYDTVHSFLCHHPEYIVDEAAVTLYSRSHARYLRRDGQNLVLKNSAIDRNVLRAIYVGSQGDDYWVIETYPTDSNKYIGVGSGSTDLDIVVGVENAAKFTRYGTELSFGTDWLTIQYVDDITKCLEAAGYGINSYVVLGDCDGDEDKQQWKIQKQ